MNEHGRDWHDDWDRATEDALRTGDLATLRPQSVALDEDWMDHTLAAILEAEAPPTRRKWKRLAIGATAVVLATGGVAAATGTAPDFVRRAMSWPGGGQHAEPFRPAVTLYADVSVPGGGRFAAWRGEGQGVECRAVAHNWDGRERSSAYATTCGEIAPASDPDREELRYDYTFSANAAETMFYPVVHGVATEQDATRVRVRGELWGGESFRLLVPLDPASHGFGVVVPGERTIASQRREWDTPTGQVGYWDSRLRSVQLDLLDSRGQLLRTVSVLEVTERELDPALTSYDDLGR